MLSIWPPSRAHALYWWKRGNEAAVDRPGRGVGTAGAWQCRRLKPEGLQGLLLLPVLLAPPPCLSVDLCRPKF